MFGRLRRPADFEAVLATPVKARSAHFAAHHLPRQPAGSLRTVMQADGAKLSTIDSGSFPQAVDDPRAVRTAGRWFGVVVPKRHARKATTRNLLRRQIRSAIDRHHAQLAHGMWLLRLRAPLDARRFRSAAPACLRSSVRAELDALLQRVAE